MPAEQDDLQALWQRSEGDNMRFSVEELERKARSLARTVRRRNVIEYAAAAVAVVGLAVRAVLATTLSEQCGFCLVALGAVFVAGYLRRRGGVPACDPSVDTRSLLASYRRALERQRDLLASVGRWYLLPFVPGFALILVGRSVDHSRAALVAAVAGVALFVAVWLVNRAAARGLQREIDALGEPR